jgi:hypothetical protein
MFEPLVAWKQHVLLLQVFLGGMIDVSIVNDLLEFREVVDSLLKGRALVF